MRWHVALSVSAPRICVVAILATSTSACLYGGGPSVGYGARHGWFAGVEAGAGIPLVQASAGYQIGGVGYARLDAGWDGPSLVTRPRPGDIHGGGRLGGGIAFDAEKVRGGTFVVGGNVAWVFERDSECRATAAMTGNGWSTAVVGWLDVRYLGGEVQVVFTPRIERHACLLIP